MENPYEPPRTELMVPQTSASKDAMRFWRMGLPYYNGAQFILTLILVVGTWPRSRVLFTAERLGAYVGFVIAANVLYCAAIVVEIFLLLPFIRPHAPLLRRVLLVLGIVLACCLAGGALVGILYEGWFD